MKVLITGGAGGIGFLTGCVLASRGHSVILTVKSFEEVKTTSNKIKLLGLDILVCKLDITDSNDIENVLNLFKEVDVLFLHAGVGYVGLLSNLDIDLFRDMFEVNVFSNLRLIQLFLDSCCSDKKVVMTSSLLAGKSLPFFGGYSMTKKCIDIMCKSLCFENLFNNNSFVLVKPGAYHTGFNQYMILAGLKNNIDSNILITLNKLFLLLEEKKLNSIVCKIIIAIEKGSCRTYYSPLWQRFLLMFIN